MKIPRSMLVVLMSFMLFGTGALAAAALNPPRTAPPGAAVTTHAQSGARAAPGSSTPAASPQSATCGADQQQDKETPDVNAQGTPEANDQGTPQANEMKSGTDQEDVQDTHGNEQSETGTAKENTSADPDNLQCGDQHEDAQSPAAPGTPSATPAPKR